jgi:hypothetical protein
MVEGTVTWSATAQRSMKFQLHTDGSFELIATMRDPGTEGERTVRETGSLTAAGELLIKGNAVARVAADGTVSVIDPAQASESGATGQAAWKAIGTLDEQGVFTHQDGRKVSVTGDGTMAGTTYGGIRVAVGGTPAKNRTAVFLIVALFGATPEPSDEPTDKAPEPAPSPPSPPPPG